MYYPCSENKGPDHLRRTAKLICAFVFAYANCWFSHAEAHLISTAYSQQQKEGQNSLDMNNNSMTGEKSNHKQRYTAIMKTYTIIIGKLRGEEDFQQPPKSRMQVVVTHVEKNGYFFWGQVLSDVSDCGIRCGTNISVLNYLSRIVRKQDYCLCENKGAFVFATRIVQILFFLNPKFQASSLLL